jgi:hypothetical protein
LGHSARVSAENGGFLAADCWHELCFGQRYAKANSGPKAVDRVSGRGDDQLRGGVRR